MKGSEGKAQHVPRWKRWVFSFIWLPDDRQGYVLPAVWRAMRAPAGRPDLIYSTAPPFSVHLAGLLLKGLTGARWVAEFRDPWTTNPWKPDFVRSSASDWVEQWLERVCLGQADIVIPVTNGIRDQLREADPFVRLETVRNGIEQVSTDLSLSATDLSHAFSIVYVGSFYHTRDPFPFLEAVASLVADATVTNDGLRVRFIGSATTYGGRSIVDFVTEWDLDRIVEIDGWMERDECLGHVQSADALLLLATDQPDQVPNKLYEYLGSRRPILAVVDADGESARMLHRSGGHTIVCENETAPLKRALSRMMAQRTGPVGDLKVLSEWTTENQMSSLVAAVGGQNVS